MRWWRRFLRRFRGRTLGSTPDVCAVLEAFQDRIDLRFRDQDLLRQALTHRSFLGSSGGDPALSNERLEFLGDAVLELTVIEFLYAAFPRDREGNLTKKKGLLVSRDVLAQCAEWMGLGEFVLLSDAEREAGGSARSSILSDTFEAVIGGVFLDSGLDEARRFAKRHILCHAGAILRDQSLSNHKSLLQELVQARFRTHPRYRVVSEAGPDHQKSFHVEVSIRGRRLGHGVGWSKKEAEQAAAQDALAAQSTDGWPRSSADAPAVDAPAGDTLASEDPPPSS
jgi:ribonuclease III